MSQMETQLLVFMSQLQGKIRYLSHCFFVVKVAGRPNNFQPKFIRVAGGDFPL